MADPCPSACGVPASQPNMHRPALVQEGAKGMMTLRIAPPASCLPGTHQRGQAPAAVASRHIAPRLCLRVHATRPAPCRSPDPPAHARPTPLRCRSAGAQRRRGARVHVAAARPRRRQRRVWQRLQHHGRHGCPVHGGGDLDRAHDLTQPHVHAGGARGGEGRGGRGVASVAGARDRACVGKAAPARSAAPGAASDGLHALC